MNIVLTESQFKDFMRLKMNENSLGESSERELNIDEIEMLLHKMIDNDFICYFKGGQKYACAYLNDKAEIFESVCSMTPVFKENGNIGLYNKQYGYFEMDNLLK